MKILINAISAKNYSGGAFQITQNFLLKSLEDSDIEWYYIISQDVDEVIGDRFTHLNGIKYFVFPTQPDFGGSYKRVRKEVRKLEAQILPDVVYSITAPSYFSFKSKEVMRFTNPWVTHPNKYSWATMSIANRLMKRIYCWNQRRMMRKTSYFVTQTETTKKGIMRITGVPPENVKVVNNVLPQVFNSLPKTPQNRDGNWIDVACVGAPVPHKNFDILPAVVKELKTLGVEKVRFHVTIPVDNPLLSMYKRELDTLGLSNRIITHGRCSQNELAEMYRGCQLCFLPTLLEVFSASTLEAMYFHLPVVATNFDFNSEVMGDSCLYYEPMNAKDAAIQIKKYVDSEALREEMKKKMGERLQLFGDYDKHFNDILDFLKDVAIK